MKDSINLQKLCEISIKAGAAIMEVYQEKDFTSIVDFKADNSPLTLADKNSDEIIVRELELLDNSIPVISEEGKNIDYEERKEWKAFWLVDPLDGTKEFIKRNGEFTVNIALMENNQPVLGVIYVPAQDILYWGQKGVGAWKKSNGITTSIQVSNHTKNLVAVGSRSHASDAEGGIFATYDIQEMISAGSSLKFCMVAEGKADLYLREGPTMEWDTAAGQAILEAAGGKMLTLDGEQFAYNKASLLNGGFVCTNGKF